MSSTNTDSGGTVWSVTSPAGEEIARVRAATREDAIWEARKQYAVVVTEQRHGWFGITPMPESDFDA